MRLFFKYFLAALLAIMAFFLIIVLFIAVMAGSSGDKTVDVDDHSILYMDFKNEIVDYAPEQAIDFDFNTFQPIQRDGLTDVLRQLKKAKADDRIDGIFMEMTTVKSGLASAQEIREALIDFKESGKWIVAYSDMYSQGAYYMASVADEVYLQPEGMMELKGFNASTMFFKNMLDKVGVDMQVIRPKNNKFKSAVEPFLLDSMSAANEEQLAKILESIWVKVSADIASSRELTQEELEAATESLASRNAEYALEAGLIDGVKYKDEILVMLKERTETPLDEDLSAYSIGEYKSAKVKDLEDPFVDFAKDKIAIVYAEGEIQDGEGQAGEIIGGAGMSRMIREARRDSSIKAVVLRVNSPGGSALASDLIWREVIMTKEVKPVIVSMGNVAASGGYYISCPADKVFASKTTITGSIGVFGTIPNTQKLEEEYLGITHDGVKTHNYADMFELHRPMRDDELAVWQEAVDNIYDDFTGKVADGRSVEQTFVDSVGQGRVWSGTDALDIGLIDEWGGLMAAVEEAVELSEVEEYRIKVFPEPEDPVQAILKELGMAEASFDPLEMLSGEERELLNRLRYYQKVANTKGVHARMPFDLEIR